LSWLLGINTHTILHISDSEWKNKSGVPGIGGTSSNNIYKEPSFLWDENQEEDNIKARLLRFFKSRKKKKETKVSVIKIDTSFSFPKLKVLKDSANVSKELSNSEKGHTSDNPNKSLTKRSIQRVKSLPTENPSARQEDPTKQVVLFTFVFSDTNFSSLIFRLLEIFIKRSKQFL
jgi:hypothetical protein